MDAQEVKTEGPQKHNGRDLPLFDTVIIKLYPD
jgi:hypothetical protein